MITLLLVGILLVGFTYLLRSRSVRAACLRSGPCARHVYLQIIGIVATILMFVLLAVRSWRGCRTAATEHSLINGR